MTPEAKKKIQLALAVLIAVTAIRPVISFTSAIPKGGKKLPRPIRKLQP